MSARAPSLPLPAPVRAPWWRWPLLVLLLAASLVLLASTLPWTWRLPADALPPLRQWVTAFFAWLGNDASLGFVSVRQLTRGFAWLLGFPLAWSEALLADGFKGWGPPALPWLGVVLGMAVLGHHAGGRGLGTLAGLLTLYLAVFGVWQPAMETVSLVLVAAPLAAGGGLLLGIWATRSRRAEAVLTALFDLMQSIPHLAYLGPVIVLFGFGQVPALLATALFALPPMARLTTLGIRTVPPEVVEAGRMAGCTERQLLLKVQLPAARPTLLLGLNQVINQCLAMVVITSLIGAVGLGQKLMFSLQQLRVGQAVEQGVAVVILAVLLDRISRAYALREPRHGAPSLLARHGHLALGLACLLASWLLAPAFPDLARLPPGLTVTTAPFWDGLVRWVAVNLFEPVRVVRDGLTANVLLPLRNLILSIPWTLPLLLVAAAGWSLGGWRLALRTAALVAFILLTGMWVQALMTLYLTTAAVILCILIGIPLGIWAASSPRVGRVTAAVCDTLQTFPSFIYLIPVVMLLRVGDLSNIVAIVGYAAVPAVRYTQLGLARLPPEVIEAATASGCTRRQLLWKVRLPLAFPEIMLGINQTIMMALAMTAITALIGSRDLGQEILKALPEQDTGRGLLAGLCIAALGMIADRLIRAWSDRRRRQLGLAA
jgi:glycine betaine/proline transport system permease protein